MTRKDTAFAGKSQFTADKNLDFRRGDSYFAVVKFIAEVVEPRFGFYNFPEGCRGF
jgi:hypothetical protein